MTYLLKYLTVFTSSTQLVVNVEENVYIIYFSDLYGLFHLYKLVPGLCFTDHRSDCDVW